MEFSDSYTKSLREEYAQNGYVRFPEVIPRGEALELGVELKELIESRNVDVQWQGGFISEEVRKQSKILDMHEVHEHSDNFNRLRRDPRIMARLAVLLGGPVIFHHDKGFVKPGAKGDTYGGTFPPHQDYPFFPHENYNMLAAIVYMTDITEDMGPVKIFPGSHANGPLPTVEGALHLDDEPFPPEEAVTMTGKAGDMVAFNLNTVHMSGHNKSLMDRVSWLIQVRGNGSHRISGELEPNEGELLWDPSKQ